MGFRTLCRTCNVPCTVARAWHRYRLFIDLFISQLPFKENIPFQMSRIQIKSRYTFVCSQPHIWQLCSSPEGGGDATEAHLIHQLTQTHGWFGWVDHKVFSCYQSPLFNPHDALIKLLLRPALLAEAHTETSPKLCVLYARLAKRGNLHQWFKCSTWRWNLTAADPVRFPHTEQLQRFRVSAANESSLQQVCLRTFSIE